MGQSQRRSHRMAIFHLAVKTISRSAGRSATAAAAYRAACAITDHRTGEIHDYTRKGGVASAVLVLPVGAPAWAGDRAALWNAAEQAERRKNSTVAREFEVALPDELGPEARTRLAHDLARELVAKHGCAADVAIHVPGKEGDHRNHHAHILLTTRQLGPEGFTAKTRELDDKASGSALVMQWRERFAVLTNEALREADQVGRVDHRRLGEQGITREPTRHLGPAATGYERRTGESSWKRQAYEREAEARLVLAHEAGELERQSACAKQSILDLSGDLSAALTARAQRDSPAMAQITTEGVRDFRALYEAEKERKTAAEKERGRLGQEQEQQRLRDAQRQRDEQKLASAREQEERWKRLGRDATHEDQPRGPQR